MAGERKLAIIVLAAGKGKRMHSRVPKVLHELCGRPLLSYVLDAIVPLNCEVVLVVAPESREVRALVGDVCFAQQKEPLGTGHAVMVALEGLDPSFEEVLVIPGDSPMVSSGTLTRLLEALREREAAASVLVTELDDPTGYGRVVRYGGSVSKVIEERDADEGQRSIHEVSVCTYAFDRASIEHALRGLGKDNAQGEYYLTGVVESLIAAGKEVVAVECEPVEAFGINDHRQLAKADAIMRSRINESLMASGVTMVDPATTYIDHGVRVGRDTVLMPSTLLLGKTTVGEGCTIGPFTKIKDSSVGNSASVEFSWLDGCDVGEGVGIGPYAKVRPGCTLGPDAKVGSFVELKKTTLGKGSKVPHLSYIGDATIGEDVNVGAGSITCNYDGDCKHRTEIGDRAFIGSDTMIVAPVRIGDDAVTGAGSTIYRDVPDGALGIERNEQENVEGYSKKKRKSRRKKAD